MIEQFLVFFLSLAPIWLTNHRNPKVARYGCLLATASQPFWYYITIVTGQWGLFCASFFFTYSWGSAFYRNWIRP